MRVPLWLGSDDSHLPWIRKRPSFDFIRESGYSGSILPEEFILRANKSIKTDPWPTSANTPTFTGEDAQFLIVPQ
jgi:hypothetical protein